MPSSGGKTCALDRKSTRLNSSHGSISYAVFCLKTNICYSDQIRIAPVRAPVHAAYSLLRHSLCQCALSAAPRPAFVVRLLGPIFFFFFNDTATTEISPLPLHAALPICSVPRVRTFRQGCPSRAGPVRSPRSSAADRKSTRLNSSHGSISYAAFCLT